MKKITNAFLAGLTSLAMTSLAQSPAANHLVLSEIGVAAPGSAEFTEIYNRFYLS